MDTASQGSTLNQLLSLIPLGARRILDLGCRAGELGAQLKARQPAYLLGVESDPTLARQARRHFEQVIVQDLAEGDEAVPDGPFDCILCAEALEHVRQPEALLRRLRPRLAPGGTVIAGFGNMRHHPVVTSLLEGTWHGGADGLPSAWPIRFFTRREFEKLFYQAGFAIREMTTVPGQGYTEWQGKGRPGEVKIGHLHIAGLPAPHAEEFYIERYLVQAAPAPPPDHGLTSIVIVTHNQLPYTRLCVDSIRLVTTEPIELVFVDNASTDGTQDYLRSLGVKLILNDTNRGFPAAANQGIQASTGKQILLLNNDCIVTAGWLRRLLEALYAEPHIGLVGPCTNRVSGEQQVTVSYDDDRTGLDGFAWDWAKTHHGRRLDTDRLVGFCLLFRRELVERIGPLDERFGIGYFEDDDFCKRALQVGYRAVIAVEAFVHHFAGTTFMGSGVDFAALMNKNQQLYREKWQTIATSTVTPPPAPSQGQDLKAPRYKLRVAPGGGLLLSRATIQLSLCMIVRDNARTIKACLESIRPWVDEIIVVDTGSKDDTATITASLGAQVFHFPWCDSFAAARNESLRHARGRWVFWMDSDDTIDEANGRKLRRLALGHADPSVMGHVMQVHCPGPGDSTQADVTIVDHVKLFRNLPGLQFEGRIHEQIIPAIRRARGELAWSDVFVVHSGYDHSPEGQAKKKERDLHLLHLEFKEQPQHPFTLFNLGMTYADLKLYPEAVDYLQRCLAVSGEGESHVRKAYALLVNAHAQLGRSNDAWQVCHQGLRLFPKDAELLFRKAILLQESGRFPEAVQAYLTLLQTDDERHFSSVVRGMKGFLARHNLALAYTELGDFLAAEKQWNLVLAEVPDYPPAWHGLADLLMRQHRHDEADVLANRLVSNQPFRMHGLMLKGEVAAARGEHHEARRLLEEAGREYPQALEPLKALCRHLFEHGPAADAEAALRELVLRNPADGAAHHNLGTLFMNQGRFDEAVCAYRLSLEHRPGAIATRLHLGYALQACGCLDDAISAWEEVLRLEPGNVEATQALCKADKPVLGR